MIHKVKCILVVYNWFHLKTDLIMKGYIHFCNRLVQNISHNELNVYVQLNNDPTSVIVR